MMTVYSGNQNDQKNIYELKKMIDDENYVSGAIQRIAQVLSDEVLAIRRTGVVNERRSQRQ